MKKLLLTSIAVTGFILSALSQVPGYIPTNGLIGWWPFNGNANDESGNGNNGQVNGATLTTDRNNVANKAYSFNGTNNYISSSPSNLPLLNSDLTISAWFKMASYPTLSSIGVVSWGQWTTNNARYIGFRQGFTNKLTYAQFNNDVDCTFGYTLNQWYQYLVTYSNNTAKFFINGNAIGTFTISSANTLNGLLFFGKSAGSTDFIDGSLDDIGMWNRALDSAEISKLFKAIVITTGLNSESSQSMFKIFPNPTQGHIAIDFDNAMDIKGYQLKITNSLGQPILEMAISQRSTDIDLSTSAKNGFYFIQITNREGQIIDRKKIVLE